jgi:hypothetical protein
MQKNSKNGLVPTGSRSLIETLRASNLHVPCAKKELNTHKLLTTLCACIVPIVHYSIVSLYSRLLTWALINYARLYKCNVMTPLSIASNLQSLRAPNCIVTMLVTNKSVCDLMKNNILNSGTPLVFVMVSKVAAQRNYFFLKMTRTCSLLCIIKMKSPFCKIMFVK